MSDAMLRLAHGGRLVIWNTTKDKAEEVTSSLCQRKIITRSQQDLGLEQTSETLSVVFEGAVEHESDAPKHWELGEGIDEIFALMDGQQMLEVPFAAS